MNIDPRGMTVIDWTDRTALVLDRLVQTERLDDPEKWQDWANNLAKTPNLEGQNTPNPYQFDDWMEWAMRFNQAVNLPG